ncbi:MAG: hypothetical protein QNJ20_10285 [Paracoccaceae bacterium]|nr:hypothetical protein [Paracoccaceae bacterium]
MPPEPRTAFVHIGAPKTGTTAIQAAFSDGRKALAKAGFHYLSGDRNHSERLALAFWAEEDAQKLHLLRHWPDHPFSQEVLRDALDNEIARTAPRDLVLSAEELGNFSPGEVMDLIAFLRDRFDRLHIIAYVRHPADWVQSAAQQGVKWSGDVLEDCFKTPRLPAYQDRFHAFMQAVPSGDFDMRVFGGPRFDAVADFATAIGLATSLLPHQRARINVALTQTGAIALSSLNKVHPPFVEYRHNPCRPFNIVDMCRQPGPPFVFARETMEAAADALAEEVDWLNWQLGTEMFKEADLPRQSLDTWFGHNRAAIEDNATRLFEVCRGAQNEKALSSYLRASQETMDGDRAEGLLNRAALLATDRWSMGQIAELAVKLRHPGRHDYFAKQRLMRRIEAPESGDPSLAIGNPFDRFWSIEQNNDTLFRAV